MNSDNDLKNEENVNMNIEPLYDTQAEVFDFQYFLKFPLHYILFPITANSSNINKLNLKLHEKTNILCLACKNMNVQAQVFDEPLAKKKSKLSHKMRERLMII
uniref:Uncharacterized protein n=1 Tax=Glossina pallidipes TaxID=7398 RepID=A0A1A9ZX47_GLOPL